MTQETIVRVMILSETYTPETITQCTGLQCDKSWHVGDLRKHTRIVEKTHGWVLHSGLPKTASLESHMEAILRIFEPVKIAVKNLSMTETVEMSVVIYAPSEPALCFDKMTMERIAELGAGMDIDLYVWKKDSD